PAGLHVDTKSLKNNDHEDGKGVAISKDRRSGAEGVLLSSSERRKTLSYFPRDLGAIDAADSGIERRCDSLGQR
ncbi:MAG TPA: hypothetical protein VF786_06890, partial [Terriglobales bacterium]